MQLSQIDLNLLRVLDALLAERSVTRAAEELHVTQQAASGSLRRLREIFDDLLLVRVGREMELTPLARGLQKPLREALLTLENTLNHRPIFDPKTTARTFRIAISDYACFVIMPHVLKRLAEEAPSIVFEVQSLRERSFAELDHGDLDYLITLSAEAFMPNRVGENIRERPLFQDDFVCVADGLHPELKKGMSRELYMSLPHCLVRFGPLGATLVQKAWREQKLNPRVVSTAPGFATMIFMIRGTTAIGTVQRKLAGVLADALELQVLECPVPIDGVEEHLFWHDRSSHDPAHDFVQSLFERVSRPLMR